jgi:ribose transport system permease protein
MADNISELNVQELLDQKAKRKKMLLSVLPFAGLVFISVFFIVVTRGGILKPGNLNNLLSQCFSVSLVAVGASFVYAHGGFDFSIGTSCGLAQLVCAVMLLSNMPTWSGFVACIAIGVICSLTVGGSSLLFRIPVFIASLCVRSICWGIVSVSVSKSDISINYAKYASYNNEFLKLGVLLFVIAAGYYLFEYTSLGKSVKAIGGNTITARQAGVNIAGSVLLAYTLLGICVGIAGFFQLVRLGSVTGSSGSGLEFDIMTALVLGGFPLTGGSAAKIRSAIIGAFTVTILSNGLILWGVNYVFVSGLKGLLFLVIVAISYDRTNLKQMSFVQN